MALIIFDIDGTLLETGRVTVPAVQRTFAAYGLEIPEAEAICSFFGRPVEEYHAWLASYCPEGAVAEIVAATDKLELELIGSEGCLYPGTRRALQALLDAGHSLAVCSNAPEDYMAEFLDAHEVRSFFREVRCRGSRSCGKREMVAELMSLIPDRPVIVIGDRHDDVAAAHANGGLGIAAAYGFGSNEEFADADARVHAMDEVPGTVERLVGQACS